MKKYYTDFRGASRIGGNGWSIVHSSRIPIYTTTYDTLQEAENSVREIRETGIYTLIEED